MFYLINRGLWYKILYFDETQSFETCTGLRNRPVQQETGERITVPVEVFDKNRDFKVAYPHRHDDFYEILFITHGTGTYLIDFRRYDILPNKVFFLSPGQIHEIELSDDVQGYIFLFTSSFYRFNSSDPFTLYELPYFYPLGKEAPPLQLQESSQIQSLSYFFSSAITESEASYPDHKSTVRAWLELILIFTKRLYPESQEEKGNKGKILVKRFKQLIEEKCQDNLSVKQYAELLGVTSSHLSETVKLITGRTSTDLINDRMVLEIKRLLVHTDLTISEIAFRLNFSDQSYFTKYFKKLTHMSPAEFRKEVS